MKIELHIPGLSKKKGKNYCTAVLVAAGSSSRMQGTDKILTDISGEPVLAHTIRCFEQNPLIDDIILVVREDRREAVSAMVLRYGFSKIRGITLGGETRTASVMAGLDLAAPETTHAAIHDGARPLVTQSVITEAVETAFRTGAAAPAVPVKDTIKVADRNVVTATPNRSSLFAVQTPQVFDFDLLRGALQKVLEGGGALTDDCAAVEALGMKVHLTQGDEENIRGHFRAEAAAMRIGHGYDVHRLVAGRKLILGGVEVPHSLGLLGHSDADVLLHAIMDALLGAAALGDIGHLFPDTDPAYEGISSVLLLKTVGERISGAGYAISNIDATVIAQKPKLAPYIPAMRKVVAETLGIQEGQVNLKATTEEHLGFSGREEGIAAHAVCLIDAL